MSRRLTLLTLPGALVLVFGCAGAVSAQGFGQAPVLRGAMTTPVSLRTSSVVVPPPPDDAAAAEDMAMPDDLGAPLAPTDAAPPAPPAAGGRSVSVDSPIAQIVAAPGGRAVLDQDLPGLCERPEFSIFKGMSLARLAKMSSGRISDAKLLIVQADLTRINGPIGR